MSNPHEVKTVKCAGCGRIKQEANHWFLTWAEPGFVEGTESGEIFMCAEFSTDFGDDVRPVCGQGCAQKELETWMTRVRNQSSTT